MFVRKNDLSSKYMNSYKKSMNQNSLFIFIKNYL